jgi:hypothetical protein
MTTTPMPDSTDIAVDQTDLPAVQAELASYRPATAFAVVGLEQWLARRRALWRRLDELSGAGGRPPPHRSNEERSKHDRDRHHVFQCTGRSG